MSEFHFSNYLSDYYKENGYFARREVDTGYGIADIVLAKKNLSHCDLRKKHGQKRVLVSEKYFTVLKYMPDIDDNDDPVSLDFLQDQTKLSYSYLKYTILKELSEYNYIKLVDRKYVKVNGWMPIINEMLAIESKLKDWRKGIKQACRYKTFADKVYLAVPPETVRLVNLDQIVNNNIGLISFSQSSRVADIVVKAPEIKPNRTDKRNYVAESFWEEFSS